MTSEAKKEKDILEITKGENANLAGMEPRCPKCGREVTWWITSKDCMPVVRCRAEKCDEIFRIKELSDFAQFFRSPAPTPPLDVEAIADKFYKILTVEVCCECGEPRFPQKQKAGDETKVGWPACVNEACVAYGEQKASSAYRCPISEQQREEILSLLRRHIASPAPQPPICDGCGAGLMLDRGAFYDCFACGHNREKQTTVAASPAQPEKRDEWVSVDERLPELHKDPLEVQVMFRDGSILNNAVHQTDGDWFWNGKFFSEFDIIQWRLAAPPQSGKEGQ